MIALKLCEKHKNEAESTFLLEFLAKHFQASIPFSIREMNSADVYRLLEKSLTTLGCKELKRDKEKIQVTGVRPSGVVVILRCEAHTEKRTYAYMINTPGNKNLQRIDNAADHPEQVIRWDHQHLGLPKDNKTVSPSFTTGLATLDLPIIQEKILLVEQKLATG